jgi:hypothetical protein
MKVNLSKHGKSKSGLTTTIALIKKLNWLCWLALLVFFRVIKEKV